MMSSDCLPIMSGLPAAEHLGDVTLTNIDNNENVNKQFLESMPNDNSALMSGVMKKPAPGDTSYDETHCEQNPSRLKKGDLVHMITFVDIHRIYVRNVKDNNSEFHNFIKSINSYCSTAKSIRKVPRINDVVGAKFKIDKLFYRAKILKKIDVIRYRVQFIDYGNEENVTLSNMVSLPTQFIEVPSKISRVKLKDVQICKLNKDARAYLDQIRDYETIKIDYVQEGTNWVTMKTSTNRNINSHLNSLIFGNHKKLNTFGNDKCEDKTEIGSTSALITSKPESSNRGVVYGPENLATVSIAGAPERDVLEHDDVSASTSKSADEPAPATVSKDELHVDNHSSKFITDSLNIVKKPASAEHGKTLSVVSKTESSSTPATSFVCTMTAPPAPPVTSTIGTMTESPAPPVTSTVGTMTESPAPPVTSTIGTMTESPAPPASSRWKRFKKLFRRYFRRFSDS